MTEFPKEQGSAATGEIGVLFLHPSHLKGEFTNNWARSLAQNGRNLQAPLLLAAGENWEDFSPEIWQGWLAEAQTSLAILKERCEYIFVIGIASAATLALQLAQSAETDIEGLVLVEPSLPQDMRRLRKIWKTLAEELYFIDQPLFLFYPASASTIPHKAAQVISEAVSSPLIREVLIDNSIEELSLVAGEVETFIGEVVHGFWHDDESSNETEDIELIDAEFQSIIAGLSLDESTPSNFLDDLDRPDPDDHFLPPNPRLAPFTNRGRRNAIFAMIVGPIYAISAALADFNPFGIEPWPGLVAFLGGLILFFYTLQEERGDDDGAIL